jgi:hypothetical protein
MYYHEYVLNGTESATTPVPNGNLYASKDVPHDLPKFYATDINDNGIVEIARSLVTAYFDINV